MQITLVFLLEGLAPDRFILCLNRLQLRILLILLFDLGIQN